MKTRLLHLGPDATRPVGPDATPKPNAAPKARRPRPDARRLPRRTAFEGWIA